MVQQDEFSSLVSIVKEQVFQTPGAHVPKWSPKLWKLATEHKVASIVAAAMSEQGALPEFAIDAKDYWQKCALREVYYVARSKELQTAWSKQGVKSFFLKGVLLAPLYPKKGFRALRDADLIVAPEHLVSVNEDLKHRGFIPLDPPGPLPHALRNKGNKETAARAGMDALSFVHEDYFLEVHTGIVPPMLGAYPLDINDTNEAELLPEDILAHLLFHATRHHFLFGLRQLLDVAVWFHRRQPNVDALTDKLHQQNLYELAWPAWKLAHVHFSEQVPYPPLPTTKRGVYYTSRIESRFSEIPVLSISLAGSPFLCLLMMKESWKKLLHAIRGNPASHAYQSGEGATNLQKIRWYASRPFGLLRRHAAVMLAMWKVFGR